MEFVYLIINLVVWCIPLSASVMGLGKKEYFVQRFIAGLVTIGFGFIIWDVWATANNVWSFNTEYITGHTIGGLPIEEILFFITIPYSCLAIYHGLGYIKLKEMERSIKVPRLIGMVLAGICLILGLVYWAKKYTSPVLVLTSIILWLLLRYYRYLLPVRYVVFMVISYFFFIIINGILTGLPIVIYTPDHIVGTRILTIPVEDFFYNFSLLTLYLLVYEYTGRCIGINKERYR
ncbi:lycopene cyclase domain-containing protein [Candidatus Dojkabacteria bacterium]|uniref:Lycopene cyclase domain-containing protein n=1 Tax=Candidatus Dojkabacteria bacterium TaxID=2099670 RepID=A0A955L7E4_9BACT|nr:lycopene cyclase domain-containing protein [Candidatus Dojkabacteria bacterium]